jgi:hypothetical protein
MLFVFLQLARWRLPRDSLPAMSTMIEEVRPFFLCRDWVDLFILNVHIHAHLYTYTGGREEGKRRDGGGGESDRE